MVIVPNTSLGPMNRAWAVCRVCLRFFVVKVVVVVVGCFMFGPYLFVMVFRVSFSWLVSVWGFCCCCVSSCVRYLFGIRVLLCSCPMHLPVVWYCLLVLLYVIWLA